MRLQLKHIIVAFMISQSLFSSAQEQAAKSSKEKTEIDFLFSYYEQEGDSSAVTGGLGAEELTDIASVIIINIPLKNNRKLNLKQGVSYYTSASSDNIDPNTISSASHENYIGHLKWTLVKEDTGRNLSNSGNVRLTVQNNFLSYGLGYGFSLFSSDNNRGLLISLDYSYDKWAFHYPLSKLYPREIRFFADPLPTDTRQTLDLSLSYSHVLNYKMQGLIGSGMIYQWGLLSTPFHRVYFQDRDDADLERLPSRRVRIPVFGRFNYYVTDFLIARTFYRFYFDNFGVTSHTFNLETPVKFTNFFSVYPYYRLHLQNGSKYFSAYKTHNQAEVYYTSDYDLSSFHSQMIGGGLRLSPPLGINLSKKTTSKRPLIFKEIELRYGRYWRSNGLRASIISFNFGFLY